MISLITGTLHGSPIVVHQALPDDRNAEDRLLLNYANDLARLKANDGTFPAYPSLTDTAKCFANLCGKDFYNSNTAADIRLIQTGIQTPNTGSTNVPGGLMDSQQNPKAVQPILDGIEQMLRKITIKPY